MNSTRWLRSPVLVRRPSAFFHALPTSVHATGDFRLYVKAATYQHSSQRTWHLGPFVSSVGYATPFHSRGWRGGQIGVECGRRVACIRWEFVDKEPV